jgi:hypothetical protein
MPTAAADVKNRIDRSLDNVDQMLASHLRRAAAAEAREEAEREGAAREQAKADALRRVEIAARFDPAFAAFGESVPAAAGDERPGAFRKRLFDTLRRRLPSNHEWANVRADEVPADARAQIEALVIKAATAEGLRPSAENLPRDGSLVSRVRTDENGAKSIEWYGDSFIKQFSRPTQRVIRIQDPKTGTIWHGDPMPKAW